ncbi:uncharacterized protein LOC126894396 isoform X24 [Daktulosphaira vitifoliae]|uniref:uncharacterized protein LOC126894396 isoform X23 n=1 Tax=Daktulosphaira vitifoliae TaxID=58002 RepID=UPI0021A97B4A|nr:uncharacterized protein LOC126894396 isoform X23 [Daktulosphaira vitifoliae]XP_050521352.1 uncharacterized protein LOC126894396 isoform X24 [Daktulosphaira vitifoliae]
MDLLALIILIKSISFCVGLSYLELHCNFSKYMLNFFKHNEKYLLHLEKRNNIQPVELEDLNTYGAALKTHGEIIMAMLDALRTFSTDSTANDLMAINLYLNNVSGSLNFITRNSSGKYDQNLLNVLNGYKLHHQIIVDDLNEFINSSCTNVTVVEEFVKCPDYNTLKEYNIKDLPKISEQLKKRLTNYDINNTAIMINKNEVFNALNSSLKLDQYKYLNPKNLLFFDLFNHDVQNEHFILNNEDGKFTSMKNKENLNLLRYATVKIKCPDKSYLNLSNIFQYFLYNFSVPKMYTFQQLVLCATIQPLITLIRSFSIFSINLSNAINFECIKKNEINFKKIVYVGKEILKNLNIIIHNKIFRGAPEKMIDIISENLKKIISCYERKMAHNNFISRMNEKCLRSFTKNNRLDCTIDVKISYKIYGSNIDSLFSIIEQFSQKVTHYIRELQKIMPIIQILHKTYTFSYYCVAINKSFIQYDDIEYMCNQKSYKNLFSRNNEIDIGTERLIEVHKKDDFVFDVEDLINNLYTDIVENNETINIESTMPESQSKNTPKYIKDYLLFNNLS